MKVKIMVKETDIKRCYNKYDCPIYSAVKRVVKNGVEFSVGGSDVAFWGTPSKFIRLPLAANIFSHEQSRLLGYRSNKESEKRALKVLKPFSFKLNIPKKYVA